MKPDVLLRLSIISIRNYVTHNYCDASSLYHRKRQSIYQIAKRRSLRQFCRIEFLLSQGFSVVITIVISSWH